MNENQRQAQIDALQRERAGYLQRGLQDRVKDVDASLAGLGVEAAPARTRPAAQTRPRRAPETR